MSNQQKQIDELKQIKGNEKTLLKFKNFETIYQAKKESHMNAPQIYEYILKEYNDKARKQNDIIVNQQIKQRTKEFIKKAEMVVKVKEEQKKIKKETKNQETKAKKTVKSIKPSMGTKPFYNSEQE